MLPVTKSHEDRCQRALLSAPRWGREVGYTRARVELTTIAFSHYSERARWALDHHGVAYSERRYMPLFHMFGVWKATRGRGGRADKVSSRYSAPVLRTDAGLVLTDSGEILRWADEEYGNPETTLYPSPLREEILEFERSVEQRFGSDARRLAYWIGLNQPSVMRRLARENVGRVQALGFSLTAPAVSFGIRRGLGVDEVRALRSLERVRTTFEEVSERLGDNKFLIGDRFTAADLTLACMAAPVLLPQSGYSANLPTLESLPGADQEIVAGLRLTRAAQHALGLFETQRPESHRA